MSATIVTWTRLFWIPLAVGLLGCGGGGDDDDSKAEATAGAPWGGAAADDDDAVAGADDHGAAGAGNDATAGADDGGAESGGSRSRSTGGSTARHSGGSTAERGGGSDATGNAGAAPEHTGGTEPESAAGAGPEGSGGTTTGTGGTAPEPPGNGLPENATGSSLTPAQATQFCEQSIVYLWDRVTPVICLAAAYTDTATGGGPGTEAACQAAYEECLAQPMPSENDCATASDDLTDCSATVGEISQCYVDEADAMDTAAEGLTCANIGSMVGTPLPEPDSCQTLETTCPGMFLDAGS